VRRQLAGMARTERTLWDHQYWSLVHWDWTTGRVGSVGSYVVVDMNVLYLYGACCVCSARALRDSVTDRCQHSNTTDRRCPCGLCALLFL